MNKTMPPLWLDYRQAPPGRRLPGLALLIAGLLLSMLLLDMAMDVASETAVAERKVAKLRQAAERRRIFADFSASTASNSGPASDTPASPSAARWEALLGTLEAAGNDTVTLLSLTPGAREIVITGEAKGLGAALDYTQRLQAAPVLRNAYLAKYEVVREHPGQPVTFTVLGDWREAAR